MTPELVMKINYFIALLFLITTHEAAHAWMAERCGDPTGRQLGRITLNPLPHLDLLGTVIIPMIMIFMSPQVAIIGWGKPCPVNPRNYKNYKRDDILVALAGPAVNIIVSLLALLAIKISSVVGVGSLGLFKLLYATSIMGFGLCIFNLLPLPPLDGSHVIRHFLSPKLQVAYHDMQRYSFIILIVLINTPVLDYIFRPAFYLFKVTAVAILR